LVSATAVENVTAVETVSSPRQADSLSKGVISTGRKTPVEVYLQVNTSGESNKSGVAAENEDELAQLATHVLSLEGIRLRGLMTIGSLAASTDKEVENKDFVRLRTLRDSLYARLGPDPPGLELSMGMSADFVVACAAGSDSVRVGSAIFGSRPTKDEATS
jgi:uncharacterized pyridoxal phosphate-containing UPF0001 family protein